MNNVRGKHWEDRGTRFGRISHFEVQMRWAIVGDSNGFWPFFRPIAVRPIRSKFTMAHIRDASSSSLLAPYHGHSNSIENAQNVMWLKWIKFHSWKSIQIDQRSSHFDTISSLIGYAKRIWHGSYVLWHCSNEISELEGYLLLFEKAISVQIVSFSIFGKSNLVRFHDEFLERISSIGLCR